MSYWQAVILGVIQGLAEFLPISSDGHLAFAQHWMGLNAESLPMILFDVMAHVGTLVSIVIVFWTVFVRFFRRLLTELRVSGRRPASRRRPWLVRNAACRVTLLGMVACVPTGLIALRFKHQLEAAYGSPLLIGLGFFVTGAFLFISHRVRRPRVPLRRFGALGAFMVGVGQGLAVAPGVSRSALTICTALLFGLKRRWSAEFSFFIAFPAICGATLVKLKDAADLPSHQWAELIGPTAVGSVIAAVVGYAALRILLVAVRRAKLIYFGYYVWVIGAITIGLGLTGRLGHHDPQATSSPRDAAISEWTAGPAASASAPTLTVLSSTTPPADSERTDQHTRAPSSNAPLVHSNTPAPTEKPTLPTDASYRICPGESASL